MPEQKKKVTSDTTKVESPKIPNVAYPLKPRSNTTNLSQQYFNHLAGDESARFLFNNSGLWHQGIHLRASKFPSSEFENNKICAIADGKLIAYKVDNEYKTDAKSESSKASAVYSTGFFLLKHEVAYPKDNVLTFYSLYRHTAKLSDYKSGIIEEIVGITKSADNKIVIRDAQNNPLNPRVELKNGVTIGVRRHTQTQDKFDELLWYRETKDNKTVEHKPKSGEHWRIFNQSYEEMQNEKIKGLPLLSKHKIDTQVDVEVKLDKPIEIKAGEELGLMGEYNQIGESGEKLLHLEVFTYDNIEQFKAKAEAAYKQDREKKGIKANFLYVARGSQLYSITNGEVIELEKSKVEIMVPLADVAKQTVKKKTDKTGKDYYNVQPYLYSLPQKNKEGGIYVDSSHLTHGLLFPGVNIFNQSGNGLCIFKHGLHQNIDPKSDLTTEQKNELDPVFKSIMNELSLDKDKNKPVVFEAGKLKDLLLTSVQQRRLTGIVVKHDSEWKKTRTADFSQTCGVYRANGKEDTAKRIEKRIADLSIKLEVDGFNTDKQAYYLHPLGMIGWLAVSVGEFDWFETPLVKLILSKESKGSFNAYNITNKNGNPRESHFTPTAQYHISKMTITEIRNAQKTRIGPEGLHLFAVGIVQIIPNTLEQFLSWLSKYKSINRDIQLFDEEFQRLMPMFFWEEKVSKVASFFRGKVGVDKAAYAISREWASAGVPKGEPTESGNISGGGLVTYYDAKPGNKAHYSADVTIKALNDTKQMIDTAGGYDVVREISLSKIRG